MTSSPLRRRRRRLVLTVSACLVALLAAGAVGSAISASPVGHWDSAEGRQRYLDAYDAAFADLPLPASTTDVRTDFGIVRVYEFTGTGDAAAPLLLLPGTSSGVPVWAANLPSLLAIGDVYALDLLGEPGRSVQDRPVADDADKAAWLDQTLAQLPADRFHVVGLSIGGWTALNLALHHDDRVASVTTVDSILTYADLPASIVIRSLPAAFPWLPRSWRDSFNSWTAGGAPVEDVPVADMIEAGMQHYRMALPPPTRITPERLGGLEVPVLAIIAGESVMHDAEDAAGTARDALPDGRVHVIDGASHAVNGEHPEEIAALIADLVAELEG